MQQIQATAGVAGLLRLWSSWAVCLAMLALLLAGGCSSEGSPPAPESNPDVADPGSVDDDEPGATETNFFSIPCGGDADCAEGRVCQLRSDAGASPPRSGRCVPTDGG